jgi:hypothetical protein
VALFSEVLSDWIALFSGKMRARIVVHLTLSLLVTSAPFASGFAPSSFNGAAMRSVPRRCCDAPRSSRSMRTAPAALKPQMMLDPAHVDAFVSHAFVDSSLQHVSQSIFDLAAAVKDSASLTELSPDDPLQDMINAVDIGPGNENLQKILSTLVNTPVIRPLLQVILPPVAELFANFIEVFLPTYMSVLDVVSKTGGHEGLLPEGIGDTLKAVQRLAAQGEILRAFRILQAAWPTTSLRAAAIAAGLVAFYVLTPPGVPRRLFDVCVCVCVVITCHDLKPCLSYLMSNHTFTQCRIFLCVLLLLLVCP